MNEAELLKMAEAYLSAEGIDYVSGGMVTKLGTNWEVTFLLPDALDPNAIADPPDVRILINPLNETCELVHQM